MTINKGKWGMGRAWLEKDSTGAKAGSGNQGIQEEKGKKKKPVKRRPDSGRLLGKEGGHCIGALLPCNAL